MDKKQLVKKFDKKFLVNNLLLLLIVIMITVLPLVIVKNGQFTGADGQAEEIIKDINPEYKPWFNNIYEPASGEVESLLFALQAAMGAGFIGYFIGLAVGKQKAGNEVS